MDFKTPEILLRIGKSKRAFLALQIVAIIIFAGGLGGLLVTTDVYDDIQDTIVTTLCLSCIKLDPVSRLDFVFLKNLDDHPEFVLKNLTTGIIFIEYRSDVCKACDDMAPIVKDIFHLSFDKKETLYELVDYNGSDIHFYHINIDHATQVQKDSLHTYDKDNVGGVPMFVVITVKYDRGDLKPSFATAYGTLGLDTDDERRELLTDMIEDGLDLYQQFHTGYKYP